MAFKELKQKLISIPILVTFYWTKPFHVYIDASYVAIESILSQKDEMGLDHLIYYANQ